MTIETKSKLFNKPSEVINLIVSVLFMFCFRFIPPVDPITPYGMSILGVFIGLIYGWCFLEDTLPSSLIGLIALGTTMPTGVYGAFASVMSGYVPIILVATFFLVGALMGAGVAEYLVYKVCTAKFAAGRPWILLAVIFFGSWTVGVFTNPMMVTLFLVSIFHPLFKQAGYQPGEKTPTIIISLLCIMSLLGSIVFPWQPPTVLVLTTASEVGIPIPFSKYIIILFIFVYVYIALSLVLMKFLKCDVNRLAEIDFTFLSKKYSKGISKHQKWVLICILASCFGCLIISFFPDGLGISSYIKSNLTIIGWMILVAAFMMFVKIDGKRLFTKSDMASYFAWDIFFIIALGTTIGTMLTAEDTGISMWLAEFLGPILSGTNNLTLCIFVTLVALILTNFLNNNVVVILLASIIVALYTQGIIENPIAPLILANVAGNIGFYTPAASYAGALNHSHGYTTPAAIYKWGLVILVFSVIVCVVVLLLLTSIFF